MPDRRPDLRNRRRQLPGQGRRPAAPHESVARGRHPRYVRRRHLHRLRDRRLPPRSDGRDRGREVPNNCARCAAALSCSEDLVSFLKCKPQEPQTCACASRSSASFGAAGRDSVRVHSPTEASAPRARAVSRPVLPRAHALSCGLERRCRVRRRSACGWRRLAAGRGTGAGRGCGGGGRGWAGPRVPRPPAWVPAEAAARELACWGWEL